jgi:hypothetical protein
VASLQHGISGSRFPARPFREHERETRKPWPPKPSLRLGNGYIRATPPRSPSKLGMGLLGNVLSFTGAALALPDCA